MRKELIKDIKGEKPIFQIAFLSMATAYFLYQLLVNLPIILANL